VGVFVVDAVLPEAGWIGVTPATGFVPFMIRLITRCPQAAHAFIATGVGTQVVEGEPQGARYGDAANYPKVTWLTNLAGELSQTQRAQAVQWAVQHLGTPYSWIDDAEIGFTHLFHGWAPRWMKRRLGSTNTLMCSQLCDAAYLAAGVDLFKDGRPSGAVSPADLYRLNESRGVE